MRSTVVLAAAAVLASHAMAEDAPRKPKPKVAVLDVRSAGTIDPKTFEGVSSLIATELGQRRPDVVVVGAAEIRAMIGFEREKKLLGCSDGSCLAEIGGALGVEYLLATEGLRLGGTWVINMSLLDVVRARTVARASQRTKQEDRLVDLCLDCVRDVAKAFPSAAVSPGETSTTALREAPPPEPPTEGAAPLRSAPVERVGPETAPAKTIETGHATSTPGWALVGVGAAAALGGGACLTYSWLKHGDYQSGAVTRSEAQTADVFAKVGVVAAGVGAAAVVSGVVLLVMRRDPRAPQVTLAPSLGGAVASFSLPLP